jgi:hypothetical protein
MDVSSAPPKMRPQEERASPRLIWSRLSAAAKVLLWALAIAILFVVASYFAYEDDKPSNVRPGYHETSNGRIARD